MATAPRARKETVDGSGTEGLDMEEVDTVRLSNASIPDPTVGVTVIEETGAPDQLNCPSGKGSRAVVVKAAVVLPPPA
jgi:hypothetical protein